jgi:hypothetical protein
MASLLSRIILGYKRQPRHSKALFWVIVGAIILLVVPSAIRQSQVHNLHQARLYFSQPANGLTPGLIFPIEVRVQTTGTAINAVSSYVEFNPADLEVINMTTENSFCTFYLDNSFDNIKGKVSVSCGLPNPGFVGDSVIVHLNMRAKIAGSTAIKLTPESQVLANDGQGSNVTQDTATLTLDIKQLF